MRHKYITPEVFTMLDNDVYDGIPIAKRVREWMDYDLLRVVQDDNDFWFEQTCYHVMPKYVEQYLVKIITKRLGLKYLGI